MVSSKKQTYIFVAGLFLGALAIYSGGNNTSGELREEARMYAPAREYFRNFVEDKIKDSERIRIENIFLIK